MSQANCEHLLDTNYTKSLQGRKIFKDQCVKCFREPTHPEGLFVCLKCFNGFCSEHLAAHDAIHYHPLNLRITGVIRAKPEKQEITKLGIGIEGGALEQDEYDYYYDLWCLRCSRLVPEGEARLQGQIKSLINSHSPFRKQALVAWQIEIHPCEHILTLDQDVKNKNLENCAQCELSTNLWLCMTCGNTGCGRAQYGGVGGNNHGIAHFQTSNHPVVVKLGTITTEGQASLYCYACNTEVKDESLASHLRCLGLNIGEQKKTEKTIEELNLDININWALSKLVESKEKEEELYGPGLTGINNIGNTCYMNSCLQVLNSLDEFRAQYYKKGEQHLASCKKIPGDCFYCQISKVFWGLGSGEYSQQKTKTVVVNQIQTEEQYQEGIKPYDFKILMAKDNAEFSSNRQQDALEYLQWFLDRLDKEEPFIGESTTRTFNYQSVNRLVCSNCNGYKLNEVKTNEWKFPLLLPTKQDLEKYYQQLDHLDNETRKAKLREDPEYGVKMSKCLELMKEGEPVSVNCPKCKQEEIFISRNYFKTTPRYLVAVPNRFVLEKWVPKKLNALIEVDEQLNIADFLLQNAHPAGQKLDMAAPAKYSEANVNTLLDFGFTANAAKKALAHSNDNLENATNWIMEHMEDPTLNNPPEEEASGSSKGADPALVANIIDFGFDSTQAKVALSHNKNNAEAALEWLFSLDGNVSDYKYLLEQEKEGESVGGTVNSSYQLKAVIIHLGKSVHAGHYVAYVRSSKGWVLFNDEKVTLSLQPVLGKGYIYLYEAV